jgi:hypothetical protein
MADDEFTKHRMRLVKSGAAKPRNIDAERLIQGVYDEALHMLARRQDDQRKELNRLKWSVTFLALSIILSCWQTIKTVVHAVLQVF